MYGFFLLFTSVRSCLIFHLKRAVMLCVCVLFFVATSRSAVIKFVGAFFYYRVSKVELLLKSEYVKFKIVIDAINTTFQNNGGYYWWPLVLIFPCQY